jgi:hypothetical protein
LHDKYKKAINNALLCREEDISWNDSPLKWHIRKGSYRIYNIIFDQSIPAPGVHDNEERIIFQAETIFWEAFKAYLRLEDCRWNEILEELESSDLFRGCVQGFIGKKDSADNLLERMKFRLDNFSRCFYKGNSSVFIDLVKALPSENISLTFAFHTHNAWKSQVVKNRNVAEAVSRVLAQEEFASPEDGWRKLLVDNNELITDSDWVVGTDKNTLAHRIQPYKSEQMYIFKKSYINSGAIVLDQQIHEGMARLEALELFIHHPKFKRFYICEQPGVNGGTFGTKVIEENKTRIVVSVTNIRKESYIDTEWREQQRIDWNSFPKHTDEDLKRFFSKEINQLF